ncbi:MAG: tRNA (adenosine(37)-N6)-threonylcarbamoyltransferase complex ATPase subunit type 1 TsaE [Chloroflexota bacterium]|nr:tRNA (adenosine(37)-N6)-threonylcarbamoyltransferase complex ATPase subunit type 1 TsaE [Chloroflexota bacterium]
MPQGANATVQTLDLLSHSPEETRRLGARLGRLARPGDVLLLVGELGAGKTCLTQGIARGLGVRENASSPSFVIMKEYHGRLALYHIDLYRLERLQEVADLGLDDYLYGSGVCVVEWADRAPEQFPVQHLLVRMQYVSERERSIHIEARGPRYVELLSQLSWATKAKGK